MVRARAQEQSTFIYRYRIRKVLLNAQRVLQHNRHVAGLSTAALASTGNGTDAPQAAACVGAQAMDMARLHRQGRRGADTSISAGRSSKPIIWDARASGLSEGFSRCSAVGATTQHHWTGSDRSSAVSALLKSQRLHCDVLRCPVGRAVPMCLYRSIVNQPSIPLHLIPGSPEPSESFLTPSYIMWAISGAGRGLLDIGRWVARSD